MSKFQIDMREIVSDNSENYTLTRKSEGSFDEYQNWVDGSETTLSTRFMVTTANKSDYKLFNMGSLTFQLIKIRQMKDETNQIKLGDTFQFNDYNFKIVREKLYSSETLNFKVWYATTEVKVYDS